MIILPQFIVWVHISSPITFAQMSCTTDPLKCNYFVDILVLVVLGVWLGYDG